MMNFLILLHIAVGLGHMLGTVQLCSWLNPSTYSFLLSPLNLNQDNNPPIVKITDKLVPSLDISGSDASLYTPMDI